MNPALRLFINQYFIINIGLNLYIHISPFKRDFETISCQSQSIKLLLIYEYIFNRIAIRKPYNSIAIIISIIRLYTDGYIGCSHFTLTRSYMTP